MHLDDVTEKLLHTYLQKILTPLYGVHTAVIVPDLSRTSADATLLASYVIKLIQHELPEDELRSNIVKEIEMFMNEGMDLLTDWQHRPLLAPDLTEAQPFVNRLFNSIMKGHENRTSFQQKLENLIADGMSFPTDQHILALCLHCRRIRRSWTETATLQFSSSQSRRQVHRLCFAHTLLTCADQSARGVVTPETVTAHETSNIRRRVLNRWMPLNTRLAHTTNPLP